MHKRLNPPRANLLPSRQLGQIQRASETYLSLPDNDLLVSALAWLGATTGNADATAKAVRLFECWRQTVGPDGDGAFGHAEGRAKARARADNVARWN